MGFRGWGSSGFLKPRNFARVPEMTNPKHKGFLTAPLLPDRHPNYDLFICDVLDAIPKDDMASMEHPVFSLSTKQDMRHLRYEHNGNTLEIIPSGYGLATIHDKDVLIFVISQLIAKMKDGHEPGRTVVLRAHDLLIATDVPRAFSKCLI